MQYILILLLSITFSYTNSAQQKPKLQLTVEIEEKEYTQFKWLENNSCKNHRKLIIQPGEFIKLNLTFYTLIENKYEDEFIIKKFRYKCYTDTTITDIKTFLNRETGIETNKIKIFYRFEFFKECDPDLCLYQISLDCVSLLAIQVEK